MNNKTRTAAKVLGAVAVVGAVFAGVSAPANAAPIEKSAKVVKTDTGWGSSTKDTGWGVIAADTGWG